MYKLKKYEYKFNNSRKVRYLRKLVYHYYGAGTTGSHIGGDVTLKRGDVNSLTSYLTHIVSNDTAEGKAEIKTVGKYFIVLYGPPASGKSVARHVAYSILRNVFKENISEIEKTFIDTNVDELTEKIITNTGKSVKDTLIDNFRGLLNSDYLELQKELDQQSRMTLDEKINKENTIKAIEDFKTNKNITPNLTNHLLNNLDKYAKTTHDIYYSHRADYLSSLLFYFSVFMGKNIFMEMSSDSVDYAEKVLTDLNYSFTNISDKYTPIVIYPFVSNTIILRDRAISRGCIDGRFISYLGAYGIKIKAKKCLEAIVSLFIDENKSFLTDDKKKVIDNLLKNLFVYDALKIRKDLLPKFLTNENATSVYNHYNELKLFEIINGKKTAGSDDVKKITFIDEAKNDQSVGTNI